MSAAPCPYCGGDNGQHFKCAVAPLVAQDDLSPFRKVLGPAGTPARILTMEEELDAFFALRRLQAEKKGRVAWDAPEEEDDGEAAPDAA